MKSDFLRNPATYHLISSLLTKEERARMRVVSKYDNEQQAYLLLGIVDDRERQMISTPRLMVDVLTRVREQLIEAGKPIRIQREWKDWKKSIAPELLPIIENDILQCAPGIDPFTQKMRNLKTIRRARENGKSPIKWLSLADSLPYIELKPDMNLMTLYQLRLDREDRLDRHSSRLFFPYILEACKRDSQLAQSIVNDPYFRRILPETQLTKPAPFKMAWVNQKNRMIDWVKSLSPLTVVRDTWQFYCAMRKDKNTDEKHKAILNCFSPMLYTILFALISPWFLIGTALTVANLLLFVLSNVLPEKADKIITTPFKLILTLPQAAFHLINRAIGLTFIALFTPLIVLFDGFIIKDQYFSKPTIYDYAAKCALVPQEVASSVNEKTKNLRHIPEEKRAPSVKLIGTSLNESKELSVNPPSSTVLEEAQNSPSVSRKMSGSMK